MAHITQDDTNVYLHFTIPKVNNLPARVAACFGPVPLDPEGNPITTEAEWAWRMIRVYVITRLRAYETEAAGDIAKAAAGAAVDADTGGID